MDRKLGKKITTLHAYVATPAYDGKVHCDFAQALAEASFVAPLYQIKMTAGVMGNGAFIDLARNIFAKKFLEDYKDCTHMFFIDSDLKFEARAFVGLMRSGKPICAGAYRRRQEPEDYPLRFVDHPTLGGLWEEDGWVMCDRVATGFLCIERSVVEEMAKDAVQMKIAGQEGTVPRLFYTKLDDANSFVGEDYCFCDDYVAKYKENIPVWMDFDFKHSGFKGNLQHFLAKQIEEEEKKKGEAA